MAASAVRRPAVQDYGGGCRALQFRFSEGGPAKSLFPRSTADGSERGRARYRISFHKTVTYDLETVPQFRDSLFDKALISLVLAMAQWHIVLLAVAQLNNLSR